MKIKDGVHATRVVYAYIILRTDGQLDAQTYRMKAHATKVAERIGGTVIRLRGVY